MAGKTTILKVLTRKEVVFARPTFGYDVEEVTFQGMRFTAFDLGGQDVFVHAFWKKIMLQCDAIVFVVDAASEQSLKKAQTLIDFIAGWIPKVPFMLLANKQDLPNARSAEEILLQLNLAEIFFDVGIPHFRIFSTSAITGMGIEEAFKWLFEQLGGRLTLDISKIYRIIIYDMSSGLPLAAIEKSDAVTSSSSASADETENPEEHHEDSSSRVESQVDEIQMVHHRDQNIIDIKLSHLAEATQISAIYSAIETFSRQVGAEGLDSMLLDTSNKLGKKLRVVSAKRGSHGCLIICDGSLDPLAVKNLGQYLLETLSSERALDDQQILVKNGGTIFIDEEKLVSLLRTTLLRYLRFSKVNDKSKSSS